MKKSLILFFIVSFYLGLAGTASALPVENTLTEVYSYGYEETGHYTGDDRGINSIDEHDVYRVSITYDDDKDTWIVPPNVDYITVRYGEGNSFFVYDVDYVPEHVTNFLVNYKGNVHLVVNGWITATPATSAPVPVPAAVWLLGTGLLGLFSVRRKTKK
jgi:hypothetical protein